MVESGRNRACHSNEKRKTCHLTYSPSIAPQTVVYKSLGVNGLNIAYREAGDTSNPKLVLLHGFPSSSHQYRNLILALADRFHVIAPDYPGFGDSDYPDPDKFSYTFDNLLRSWDAFLSRKDSIDMAYMSRTTAAPSAFALSRKTHAPLNG